MHTVPLPPGGNCNQHRQGHALPQVCPVSHMFAPCPPVLQVLHGCPWLLPRPVYVLCVGTAPRTEDVGATYTLQVRVQQQGAASDIAQVRPRVGMLNPTSAEDHLTSSSSKLHSHGLQGLQPPRQ
jgi:hypothetical protein